jgi:hypothetical protein
MLAKVSLNIFNKFDLLTLSLELENIPSISIGSKWLTLSVEQQQLHKIPKEEIKKINEKI